MPYTATMRRHARFALLLGLLTLPLAAQDTPTVVAKPSDQTDAKTPRPAVPTGRITGTVLCADNHRPARGATLMLAPIPGADGTSTGRQGMGRVSLDGSYTMDYLPPGEYTVMAMLPGYISLLDQMISESMEDQSPAVVRRELLRAGAVTITGGETERYDLTLVRGAAIAGRVLFSDGAPATQVSISVEDINAKKPTGPNAERLQMGMAMARNMFTHQTQSTDDQGRFRISGLKPGTYRVAAISSLSNSDDSADAMGGMVALLGGSFDPAALRVYSGDTLHPKAAKTYELRSGDEATGIDITIPLNAYHQVKGTLTAVDGRFINRATVTLTDTTDDSVTYEADVSGQGAFTFTTVAAGTYTLAAKNARITAPVPGSDPSIPIRNVPTHATNAFADGSNSVIVKDSDVPDVTLTLTEVPLPPTPTLPDNLDPADP